MLVARRSPSLSLIVLTLGVFAACATPHQVAIEGPEPAACRASVTPAGAAAVGIRWVRPSDADERAALDAWCESVGPVLVSDMPSSVSTPATAGSLVIVSWNVNVGAGDVTGLVADLRAGRLTNGQPVPHFVLLLQEVFRNGRAVPAELTDAARTGRPLQPRASTGARIDVAALAQKSGLGLYYVPSMRNGQPHETGEDRGNAILSTLPLSDLTAIELPFERQRRVALEATVHGTGSNGAPWSLRVTNAHLENRAPARRLWVFSTLSRLRQARGLLLGMRQAEAAVLGGDLNSWGGFDDAAYRAIATRLPVEASTDRRPTFAGIARLDHLLFRLPDGWSVMTRRLDRLGSDHNPLLAELIVGSTLPPHPVSVSASGARRALADPASVSR